MSDQEFEVILAELRQLRKAISDSVGEIVNQQSEIHALRWLLQSKGIATAQELESAKIEGVRQVNQILSQPSFEDSDAQTRHGRDSREHFSRGGHHRRRRIP